MHFLVILAMVAISSKLIFEVSIFYGANQKQYILFLQYQFWYTKLEAVLFSALEIPFFTIFKNKNKTF
jgi:hypothetical protein